ncbi:FAD-dependent oxidoreductase [Nocardia brevicatena]|uniref:FAD-dependent oxidoreductase n=1 Tax=Nocardia brevicatena TaxID=37327 RepID=UPI0014614CAD|nr:NAD(P)/FAD-dependent oxidoreductase [Nocardia brevicatena]
MNSSEIHGAVIGGGIAGCSAALALTEIGITVGLFETEPRSADIGGWVTLGPAAMTVFDRLGVGERVRDVGFPVFKIHIADVQTGRTDEFTRYEPTHKWPSTHVWRRDLLAVLRDRLDTVGIFSHYGVTAGVEDLTADLVVGADGARSATRRALNNLTQPAYTGEIIRYGHHPTPAEALSTGVLYFWTHPFGVVGYVGDDRDGSFWFSRHHAETPSSTVEETTMWKPLRTTPVGELIDTSDISDPIALYDLQPEGPWHDSRTVLIGDAAHAVSPAAGRGATSAIEDAIVLARSLHHTDDLVAGLETFTTTRRPIARAAYRWTPAQPPPRVTADELDLAQGVQAAEIQR